MESASLIKKGRVRTQEPDKFIKPRAPSKAVEQSILPEQFENKNDETISQNILEFIEHPWTDIPMERSLTKVADEELWSHGESKTNTIRYNQIHLISDVYPHRDAAINVQVKGLRGSLNYDIGGNIEYLVRNGGIKWETPGLRAWFGAIAKNQDVSTNLKKRTANWQLGVQWYFPEKNSLWNVDLSQPGSRVQWDIADEWITRVQGKAIHWQIPDCGHIWIKREDQSVGIQSQSSLNLHSQGTLTTRSNVYEMTVEQLWGANVQNVNWQVSNHFHASIKNQASWKQSNLVIDIGSGTANLAPVGYKIDSHYGDWKWNLSQGNFEMSLIHQPGKKKGWEWKTEQPDSFWKISLGDNYLNWDEGVLLWEQVSDFRFISQEGNFRFEGNDFIWNSVKPDANISWKSGSAIFDLKSLYQIKLLNEKCRFEILNDAHKIDFRIGDTNINNHNFYWSSAGGIHLGTDNEFQVRASHSRWHLHGEKGLHVQCVKPFGNIRLEAGEGGYIELKGQKLHINCNDWIWRGQDSFYGVQEKGWTWAAPKGKLIGFSGDSQLSPLSWSGAEGGIEWQTYNLEQPIIFETHGVESQVKLISNRSGCEIQTGGVEGFLLQMNLHDDNSNSSPKGWRVDMNGAGPLEWSIHDKSYWRVRLDGPYEFYSNGIGGKFLREISFDGNDADHQDWIETVEQLHFGSKSREIHQLNRSYNDDSVIEWDWSQPGSQWIAGVGSLIKFDLTQENAKFQLEALKSGSTIGFESSGYIQAKSQEGNIFIQAPKGHIYQSAGQLIEQKIEEGAWRLKVLGTPLNVKRAVDIQANGQIYARSTENQVYRILNNKQGVFHWSIGGELANSEQNSACFVWNIDDRVSRLTEMGLEVGGLEVYTRNKMRFGLGDKGNDGIEFSYMKDGFNWTAKDYTIQIYDKDVLEKLGNVRRTTQWIDVSHSFIWSGVGKHDIYATQVHLHQQFDKIQTVLNTDYLVDIGGESVYQQNREGHHFTSPLFSWSNNIDRDVLLYWSSDSIESRIGGVIVEMKGDLYRWKVGELENYWSERGSYLTLGDKMTYQVNLGSDASFMVDLGELGSYYQIGMETSVSLNIDRNRIRMGSAKGYMKIEEDSVIFSEMERMDWDIQSWNIVWKDLSGSCLSWRSINHDFEFAIQDSLWQVRVHEGNLLFDDSGIQFHFGDHSQLLLSENEVKLIGNQLVELGANRLCLSSEDIDWDVKNDFDYESMGHISWNIDKDWIQEVGGRQSYLSHSDHRKAFSWELTDSKGGFYWLSGLESGMAWNGGNEMTWTLATGKKTWRFMNPGGEWLWDGLAQKARETKRLCYSSLEMGGVLGVHREKMDQFKDILRGSWREGESRVLGILEERDVLGVRYENLGEDMITWNHNRGLKCEIEREVYRQYEVGCMEHLVKSGTRYDFVWGSSLSHIWRSIGFVDGGMEWREKQNLLRMEYVGDKLLINKVVQLREIGLGEMTLRENVIETDKMLIIRAENGILFEGGAVRFGEGSYLDGGEGITSYIGEPEWKIDYERVVMNQLLLDKVETEEVSVKQVDVKEQLSVDGNMEVIGESRLGEVKLIGKLMREKVSERDDYFEEISGEDTTEMMNELEVVRTASGKIDGLWRGERITETVDLWDMVMILTSEVKRLREEVEVLRSR